ncbi:MAG: ABC transporter permease [Candidatus Hydrogenedentota bacterium]
MGFFLVLKAEIVRGLIIMRRYWFATLTGLMISYGFLMLLVLAFVSSPEMLANYSESIFDKIVGFLVGMVAIGLVGLFTQGLQGMARTGELEQVCMSPHGLVTNFIARSFVTAVTSVVTYTILLSLLAASLEGGIHWDPFAAVVLLGLTYFNLIGFGFMVGGLVLVFKQTGQIALLIRLALLLIAVGSEQIHRFPIWFRAAAHCVPITDAAISLKYVLVKGQQMDGVFRSIFVHPSFYFLILNCIIWTLIGITCFRYLENWSRDKGTLGAY